MRDPRSTAGLRVAALVFVAIWSLTTHGKYSNSGDEPHYLIVARSLAADRDLDVSNNYAANDGRLIGHDGLIAGPHARQARDGRLLSTHDIGLPVLLSPVYVVAAGPAALVPETRLARFRMSPGLLVYALVSLTILMLVAGLSHVVDTGTAAAAGAIVALSPPILSHSFLVFPEAVAFAVACVCVWWMLNPSPSERATWTILLALGVLPWCHRKYSRAAGGSVHVRDPTRPALCVDSPRLGKRGRTSDARRRTVHVARWTALPVLALALPMSAFVEWWGGFSPAARYLVPIMPFCALAIALAAQNTIIVRAGVVLLVLQTLIVAYAWQHPRTLWPIDSHNPLLMRLGPVGRAYERALPSLRYGEPGHALAAAVLIIAVNAGMAGLALRRDRADDAHVHLRT